MSAQTTVIMTCTHFLMILMLVINLTYCSQVTSQFKQDEASPSFLAQCVALAELGYGLQCIGTMCKGEEGASMNLAQLQAVKCDSDSDCMPENTGMQCMQGRCDCPYLHALNLTTCSCQQAERCMQEESCPQHNGRKCEDNYCSCYSSLDYSMLLLDPGSLFCLLPSETPYIVPSGSSGAGSLGLAVLGALLGFICVVVGAVLVVVAYKNCVCEKGDYVCDAPANIPEEHIAAWDHPSLDYIDRGDEDIVFTLCQASDNVRMSNASTIYVMDEETTNYNLTDHDNMAYVEDDDPRHD